MSTGAFIDPDSSLEHSDDPGRALGIKTKSGYRSIDEMRQFVGNNKIFDRIFETLEVQKLPCEDQCSARYYFDIVNTLRGFNGEFSKVVEVGVYMGGASCILAACSEIFDFDIDMVDTNPKFLQFSYERIRRAFPAAAKRVRLFHGDLPTYVRKLMLNERDSGHIIHHDGAHYFEQVVRDLASLYFVKDKIHSVIAQDTHLRGRINNMNFVDLAIYAIFGTDLQFMQIGATYNDHDARTSPNKFEGNYFLPNTYEGIVIPMSVNSFKYPHPKLSMNDFLPDET